MKKHLLTAVLAPAALGLLLSCSGKEEGKVIARVGGEKITDAQLEEKLSGISPAYRDFLDTPAGRRQFLEVLINEKLILLAARKSGVASSAAYKEQIESMEKDLEAKLEEFRGYLLTKLWIEDLKQKTLGTTDEEIAAYYAENPNEIVVDHLMYPTHDEAEAVLRRVKSGADFSKLARDRAGEKGLMTGSGRMPPMMKGEFIPELEDMAFKMKVGEVQGVVKTKFGNHLIKKISQTRKSRGPETDERVRRILEKKKFDAHMEKLQAELKVEVLDEDYK
ncbi:MAG: peptidylprolyl isomerase [Elusimicrobiales bacterium]|jgi:parvulin-like peptidyl-prolyl isomerase|nr:peptidylprolyl isomerase [Elusimicrobiales bacterium]